jgi:2-aminoadipate transaminase
MPEAQFDDRSLFSASVQGVPDFWRELPGILWSFDSGRPDPATFPIDDMTRLNEFVLRTQTDGALQYGDGYDEMMYGFPGLRDQLAERSQGDDGRDIDRTAVLLTSGAVQAISLALKAFVDPGDVIAVEAPTWGAVISTARGRGADVVAIPMDGEGLQVDLLEQELDRLDRQQRRFKLLYVIAAFNTPTGVSLSLERRHRLLDMAARRRFVVLEDNTYRDLRYDGPALPTLFGLDESGLVVQVGSFSKTMAPALRLGWATGHPDVIAALTGVRTDLGVSQWVARVMSEFLREGLFDAHLQSIRSFYRTKLTMTEAALHAHCDPWVSWVTPEGGFFLWVELDPRIDGKLVMRNALARGVLVRAGERFFGDPNHGRQQFRVSFGKLPIGGIQSGISRLGEAMTESRR